MKTAALYGGTTEGRELAEFLLQKGWRVLYFTATDYAAKLLESHPNLEITAHPLSQEEKVELFSKRKPLFVADATHPYAQNISVHVEQACRQAAVPYLRIIRPWGEQPEGTVLVDSFAQAAEYLSKREGNILLTTGSRALEAFTGIPDYANRIYPRVLPMEQSLAECIRLGYRQKNIICMQGPFSVEMNRATLRQVQAAFLVTKDSSQAGGVPEKLEAAAQAGAQAVIIRRPEEEGMTPKEFREYIEQL